ncbi:MAG: DUF393 domain-containing protein [Bacteroidetes bacterium]|nr:DUF393 domain-containing protein [Bacteroidota bacterium]
MEEVEINANKFPKPTLFYDGVCQLCHFSVQWIIKHDKKGIFRYENLQSEAGQNILEKIPSSLLSSDSVILVLNGQIYLYSDASLMVLKQLGGIYGFLGKTGMLVPLSIRNAIYRFIAKNRYQWFGKREVCELPPKQEDNAF